MNITFQSTINQISESTRRHSAPRAERGMAFNLLAKWASGLQLISKRLYVVCLFVDILIRMGFITP